MSTVDNNNVTYVHTVDASRVYYALIEYTPREINYVLCIEGTKITVQYICHNTYLMINTYLVKQVLC